MERFEDKLPAELVQDLRWVQKLIAEHPDQFEMGSWVAQGSTPCKTVGCIAGRIAGKRLPKDKVQAAVDLAATVQDKARRYLTHPGRGSGTEGYRQALDDWHEASGAFHRLTTEWIRSAIPQDLLLDFDSLFYLDQWPEQFTVAVSDGMEELHYASTTPELAIKRIDYFLEHGR